ncbi:MAG: ribbon-helix-helix protein, CopG family [Nanoarchaeota archaeon]|nr:ribbon-helix-helix protein, CopG family [Nanoarchaeota archaeon]
MKLKVSISMDEETLRRVEARIKGGIFRNKSHFIELATQRMLEK